MTHKYCIYNEQLTNLVKVGFKICIRALRNKKILMIVSILIIIQPESSRSFSKKAVENMDSFSCSSRRSKSSKRAKFFLRSQTPFGPNFVGWRSKGHWMTIPEIKGSEDDSSKFPLKCGSFVRHAWHKVWPQIKRRGILSPWTPKTLSQTRHSKTWKQNSFKIGVYPTEILNARWICEV